MLTCTFINLVMRFYDPEHGQVLIDGCDVRDYNIHDLRYQMGLVMQEPTLFNYPIKDNILYGAKTASNVQIMDAATLAYATEFIEGGEEALVFENNPASLLNAMLSDTYKAKVIAQISEEKYADQITKLTQIVAKSGGAATQEAIPDLIDKRTAEQ